MGCLREGEGGQVGGLREEGGWSRGRFKGGGRVVRWAVRWELGI